VADEVELRAAAGFVEPAIREEFPGLRLDWLTVGARRPLNSPREVKRRLQSLSNRYRGASVVAMRTQPIPHAYRTFFRQIGLDPDTTRIPSEAAAVARLLRGGFEPTTLIDDARLIALVETGVPVWALDASFVDPGGLGIRTSVAGDRLGPDLPLAPGRLAVTDAASIHALLFGDVVAQHAVGPRTERVALYVVSVDGVPAIHVEEALWVCLEVLRSRDSERV
jgi:DNA/RNA-binding domain of Phe-tRNA-synthetase-like protein